MESWTPDDCLRLLDHLDRCVFQDIFQFVNSYDFVRFHHFHQISDLLFDILISPEFATQAALGRAAMRRQRQGAKVEGDNVHLTKIKLV